MKRFEKVVKGKIYKISEMEPHEIAMQSRYYDLIEYMVNGRIAHIPAPLAVEVLSLKKVKQIPVSKKVRDESFYDCESCGESFYLCSCYQEEEEFLQSKRFCLKN